MDIGKDPKRIVIEPVQPPVPQKEPIREPDPVPVEPDRSPDEEPVKV